MYTTWADPVWRRPPTSRSGGRRGTGAPIRGNSTSWRIVASTSSKSWLPALRVDSGTKRQPANTRSRLRPRSERAGSPLVKIRLGSVTNSCQDAPGEPPATTRRARRSISAAQAASTSAGSSLPPNRRLQPTARWCDRERAAAEARDVDMAVFCQVSRPLPPHRCEFLSQHALSVLFVLQIRLVGGTAF